MIKNNNNKKGVDEWKSQNRLDRGNIQIILGRGKIITKKINKIIKY